MNKWKTTNLFEISDSAPKSFVDGDWIESPYITDEGVRLIQTGNIGVGHFKNRNKKYISYDSFKKLNCTEVFAGDILICRLAEPVGRSCIVPNVEEKYITSVDVCILRVSKEYSKEYLNQYLNTEFFLKKAELLSGGSTRQRISRTNLGKIAIKAPQLPQQNKIAKILSTCDTVISQTEQAIKKYQAIKQGMMTDLFTRGIDVNTGKLRPSYKEQPDLYKESELGWIPKDWELSKFEDFVIPIDGDRGHAYPNQSQLHSEGHCLFLSAKNVTKSGFAFNKNIFISHERDNLMGNGKLDRGDIIITTRGTVGNIAMYDDSVTYEHIRINSGMLILRNKVSEKIANQFIKAFLLSHVFSKQLERVLSGSAQPQITVKNVNAIYMLFPATLVEQESIVNRMIAMDRKIQTEQDTLKKYQQIKAGLMQDLLTGKVEVQTDDVS